MVNSVGDDDDGGAMALALALTCSMTAGATAQDKVEKVT